MKSTADGWLNRYLQARGTEDGDAVSRGRADAAAAAHAAGHRAGARHEPDRRSSASAPAQAATWSNASFEAQYAAAADSVLNGTGREAFDAMQDAEDGRPVAVPAGARCRLSASAFGQALKQIAQLSKADVGLEVAFADVGGWDTTSTREPRRPARRRGSTIRRGIAALVRDLGERMEDPS